MTKIAQLAGTALGLWLMAAPAVLGYAGSPASDLHRTVGPLVASLAVIAAWEATAAVRWPNVAAGAVLVLAPLVVDHSTAAAVAGVAGGLVLTAATPFGGQRRRRLGGGWNALVSPARQAEGRRR